MLPIIAKNKAVAKKINKLAKRSKKRKCAKLTGQDVKFSNWLIDGKQRERSKIAKMAKKIRWC